MNLVLRNPPTAGLVGKGLEGQPKPFSEPLSQNKK